MYDPAMVKPMREEVTRAGVKELLTPEDVESVLKPEIATTLIFINSVCGCAAGSARPALVQALKHSIKPSIVSTVFAGMERDATDRVRKHFVGYTPSSPSFGLFRKGEIVHMVQRHDIEGQGPDEVAQILISAFDKYCGKEIRNDSPIYNPRTANQLSVQ
ncbi:MAG: BrxA/BrxB family bacilliredoxin, partial [Planctomycetota bacterium]